jgi:hypothetical protein
MLHLTSPIVLTPNSAGAKSGYYGFIWIEAGWVPMAEVGAKDLGAVQYKAFTDVLRLFVKRFAFAGTNNSHLPIPTRTGDRQVASTFVYSDQRDGTQGP